MSITRDQVSAAINEIMSETFEGMAFLELCRSDAPPAPAEAGEWLWARVGVHAPYRGIVTIYCPKLLAEEITQSMFGEVDAKVFSQTVKDSLGEIANTIAGKLVGALVPEKKVMRLGLPETGKGPPALPPETAYYFSTDEARPIVVGVEI